MTRWNAFAIVALLALCVATALLLSKAGAASAIDSPTTITLSAPAGGKTTTVDIGRRDHGHGVGDYAVIAGAPLRDAGTHVKAGHLDGTETILSASASAFHATVKLAAGAVELDGVVDPRAHSNAVAVTGGTGTYSNVRGIATILTGRSGATITLQLVP
jgi:hypothetical protein